MQTMDQSLANHVIAGKISIETALERCSNAEDLRRLSGR
jgi:Tfp pilus assembly ATPase PilU